MAPTMSQPKVYLAGPEVFLPNVADVSAQKLELCARHHCEGIFPFDAEITDLAQLTKGQQAARISEENERMMHEADCVVANCTPFRSVSMDIGTGYEIGFMRGLGKPVFGYTNVPGSLAERTALYNEQLNPRSIDPYTAGTDIENFELFENLMIGVALKNFDCDVVVTSVARGAELTDLQGFEACLRQVRQVFNVREP